MKRVDLRDGRMVQLAEHSVSISNRRSMSGGCCRGGGPSGDGAVRAILLREVMTPIAPEPIAYSTRNSPSRSPA